MTILPSKNLLPVSALALSLAWLGLAVWQSWDARALPAAPAASGAARALTTPEAGAEVRSDSQAMAELGRLFGTAPAAAAPTQEHKPVAEEPKVERVPLEVLGTLAGPQGQGGVAILQGPEGQASYATGAELPGGAKLALVDTKGVVLDWAGATERKDLPEASLEPQEGPAAMALPLPGAGVPKPGHQAAKLPPAPTKALTAAQLAAQQKRAAIQQKLKQERERKAATRPR